MSDVIQACFGAHHQRKIHLNPGFDERGGDNAAGFAVFKRLSDVVELLTAVFGAH
ncbi:hypothetical protein [uncultured Ottowia sp.]|uniref:hypothetical protein n=1 Tax=uncultured Ottowia sp. TaxID=543067 RepID=UPI002595CEF4|nr:hypothetical protein [uncultured Ottowia sp.]